MTKVQFYDFVIKAIKILGFILTSVLVLGLLSPILFSTKGSTVRARTDGNLVPIPTRLAKSPCTPSLARVNRADDSVARMFSIYPGTNGSNAIHCNVPRWSKLPEVFWT